MRGGGSPIVASPQVLAGEAPAPADDVFALGGLVYELLSGRSPWSSAASLDDIREREPAPLAPADGGEVPRPVAVLVAAMLAKEAAARPDAETVVLRLREAGFAAGPAPRRYVTALRPVGDVRIDAGPARPRRGAVPNAVPESATGVRRHGLHPGIVGGALALLLAALVAVVFLLPDAVQSPQSAQPADEPAIATDAAEPGTDATKSPVPERDVRVQARQATENVLGRLLAQVQTLEARAVDRWGGLAWKEVQEQYAAGDEAYLAQDYEQETTHYEAALESIAPLLSRVDQVFAATLADARAALENGDAPEALRLFDLAVAISPGHAPAKAGLERARNLDRVLALTDQGLALERNVELDAARDSFGRAVEIDPEWQPAADGLARVTETIRRNAFAARMSEGLNALSAGDYQTARAAFRMAQELDPQSSEPADGLLQVDQGLRLDDIAALEIEAAALAQAERWEAAGEIYEKILELDANLAFAQEGRARAGEMVRLHEQLDEYLANPDSLSADRTMQRATQLVVEITRMDSAGPRLVDQRDELARLLKRAATPLNVTLVSDEQTNVSVYKVGRLGTFDQTELALRPGTYVAVGSRPGYRDVRREFRVAPEIDMEPVVVQCEEPI
jgi:tetratricopeptide (TPR) repeat protein